MKKSHYLIGGLVVAGGLAAAAGGVLTMVDEADGGKKHVKEAVVAAPVEVPPPVLLSFEITPVATPVIRGKKVARYIQIAAVYGLEGEDALEKAKELLPLLRDNLVRSLHMDPIPILGEGAELDMDALRERFMSTGKKFLGPDAIHELTVGKAEARKFIVRSPEPAPKKKKSGGGHGGGGH